MISGATGLKGNFGEYHIHSAATQVGQIAPLRQNAPTGGGVGSLDDDAKSEEALQCAFASAFAGRTLPQKARGASALP